MVEIASNHICPHQSYTHSYIRRRWYHPKLKYALYQVSLLPEDTARKTLYKSTLSPKSVHPRLYKTSTVIFTSKGPLKHPFTLRVHVAKWYILWAQCTYIGSTPKAKVYSIWVHGPLGLVNPEPQSRTCEVLLGVEIDVASTLPESEIPSWPLGSKGFI